MMVGALVLPPTSLGMTEASTTRSPESPRTRRRESTTESSSIPIRAGADRMVPAVGHLNHESVDGRRVDAVGAGLAFPAPVRGEGFVGHDLPADFERPAVESAIALRREVVVPDSWGGEGAGGAQPDPPPALRPEHVPVQIEAVRTRPEAALPDRIHPHRAEIDLDVRALQSGVAPEVCHRVHREDGEGASAQEEVLGQRAGEAQGVAVAVEGDRLPALVLDEGPEVILEIPAHAGKRVARGDSELAELVGRTDAREHQQLRGLVGAHAHQHLPFHPDLAALTARQVLDAHRPIAFQQYPGGARPGEHLQVGAAARGTEVGVGAGAAAERAMRMGVLDARESFLAGAVVVGGAPVAERFARLEKCVVERVLEASPRSLERAAPAPVAVPAFLPILGALEEGEDVVVGPAIATELTPFVVVSRVSARVDLPVDRGGAAEHPAPRHREAIAVQAFLGFGLEGPVVAAADEVGFAHRHRDEGAAVAAPRLEQQHRHLRRFAQSVGEHAARRARAGDHVVAGDSSAHFGCGGAPAENAGSSVQTSNRRGRAPGRSLHAPRGAPTFAHHPVRAESP